MAYISGANLALSLTLTAVSILLAPFITPFYMLLFADQLVPIDTMAMFLSISEIVVLLIIAGLLFNHLLHGRYPIVDRAMPKISMLGIAIIIPLRIKKWPFSEILKGLNARRPIKALE